MSRRPCQEPPMLIVRAFQPQDAAAFRDLNVAWIEEFFTVEPSDRNQLNDPEGAILAKGGRILIAELDGAAVGTAALIPDGQGMVELAKMSARADLRGSGVGKALMAAALATAREMGAHAIWLETNSVLKAALHLYRTHGFRDDTEAEPSLYARCDVQLILDLEEAP